MIDEKGVEAWLERESTTLAGLYRSRDENDLRILAGTLVRMLSNKPITAYEAARSAEPVAWAVQLPGPGTAVRFETDTDRYSDPANRYHGDWRPLFAHPTPEAPDV